MSKPRSSGKSFGFRSPEPPQKEPSNGFRIQQRTHRLWIPSFNTPDHAPTNGQWNQDPGNHPPARGPTTGANERATDSRCTDSKTGKERGPKTGAYERATDSGTGNERGPTTEARRTGHGFRNGAKGGPATGANERERTYVWVVRMSAYVWVCGCVRVWVCTCVSMRVRVRTCVCA